MSEQDSTAVREAIGERWRRLVEELLARTEGPSERQRLLSFAKAVGVTDKTVKNWRGILVMKRGRTTGVRRGGMVPEVDTMLSVCERAHASLQYILTGEGEMVGPLFMASTSDPDANAAAYMTPALSRPVLRALETVGCDGRVRWSEAQLLVRDVAARTAERMKTLAEALDELPPDQLARVLETVEGAQLFGMYSHVTPPPPVHTRRR